MKMVISAIAVLAIVGSALAFRPSAFTLGNVFCFPTTTTVVTTEDCSGQTGAVNKTFNSTGGSLATPCSGTTPDTYVQGTGTCVLGPTASTYKSLGF